MKTTFRQHITRNLLNIPGVRLKRKFLVIESDDWGTIRMASKEAYNVFLSKGLPVDECAYNKYDSLESNEDLLALFEMLSSVKDKNGNAAALTANNIVANPDFEKIKESNFEAYFYEPFTQTLKRYPAHDKVESLYREGMNKGIFIPQFHGREHLNVRRWLETLQNREPVSAMAFDHAMFSVHATKFPVVGNEMMDALDADSDEAMQEKEAIVTDGLTLFEQLWGYQSKSFIAPCYIWSRSLEPVLGRYGVRYIQGMINQFEPVLEPGYIYKKRFHYQGQQNKLGQYYLLRNVFFEPATNPGFDWVGDCLNRIETAFRWNKPAIISSHRVNYTGWLDPNNRDRNLRLLQTLLKRVVKNWPDVEFISTDQLGDSIAAN